MTLHAQSLRLAFAPARILLILLAVALLPRVRYAQDASDGFDPVANNTVLALPLPADGKIIVRLALTMIDGQTRNRIARFNAWNGGS